MRTRGNGHERVEAAKQAKPLHEPETLEVQDCSRVISKELSLGMRSFSVSEDAKREWNEEISNEPSFPISEIDSHFTERAI